MLSKAAAGQIVAMKLGLRAGKNEADANNAAYSMCAPLMDGMLTWMREESPSFSVWEDCFYNTLWKIRDMPTADEKYLLLVTNAIGVGEQYSAAGGRGGKMTFPKCNRLPEDARVVPGCFVKLEDASDVDSLMLYVRFWLLRL